MYILIKSGGMAGFHVTLPTRLFYLMMTSSIVLETRSELY